MSNYTKKTLFGSAIFFVFSLVAAGFAYLFRLYLAKQLTLSEFGLFFSLMSFIGILVIFRDLGINQATIYFVPRFSALNKTSKLKGLISKILKIEFTTSLIISCLMIIFSKFIIENYFKEGSSLMIVLLALAFFLNSMELIFQIFFNAFQNQFLSSLQNMLRNMFLIVLTFIGFLFYKNIYVPLTAQVIVYFILLVVFSIVFFKKIFPNYFKTKESVFKLKKLIIFGIPATLSSAGYLITTYSDILMLTYFRSLEEVGLYSAVIPIVSLLLYAPFAIAAVFLPIASELWTLKKIESLKFAVKNITKYVLIWMIPLAGIVLFYPEITLNLLFGNKFVNASSALLILAFGAIFYGVGYINLHILFAIKGPKINTIISLSSALINVIINLILIPRYGIIGAAIATTASYLFIFIISSMLLSKTLKVKQEWSNISLIFIAGILFIFSVTILKKLLTMNAILEAVIVICLSSLFYVLLLFLFKTIGFHEFNEIKKQLLSK